jgi:hypothetical protein
MSESNQPRDHVGRWAQKAGSEPDRTVLNQHAMTGGFKKGRGDAIRGGRYTQPIAVQATNPRSLARRAQWWAQTNWLREHNHAAGDFQSMPEAGLYDDGSSTRRMLYRGNGTALRMPSVASVRQFARDMPEPKTLDIPIEVQTPSGSMKTSVRATPMGDGTWHVSVPGGDSPARIEAAEAVRSVLEAQRVTTSLRDAGDLLEKARNRQPAGTFKMKPISSSFVTAVGYEPRTQQAVVEIQAKDGIRRYTYRATEAEYEAVAGSSSVGAAYNKMLRGGQSGSAVRTCPRCGHLSIAQGHACERHRPRPNQATR